MGLGRTYADVVDAREAINFQQVPFDPIRQPVRFSTQGPVVLAGGAPLLPDGPSPVVAGDRVLVRFQADPTENGLYEVVTPGAGADGTWARTSDFAAGSNPVSKLLVNVQEGTVSGGDIFQLATTGLITVGVTALAWALILAPAVPTWANVLLVGNFSGGTNAVLTSGDALQGEDAAPASGLQGSPAVVRGGAGDGAGGYGAVQHDLAGNQRGPAAVDWQSYRTAPTEVASGPRSFIAAGYANTASGYNSHASGFSAVASGSEAKAANYDTLASSQYSHAEGSSTQATGVASHAEGIGTTAAASGAHAEGYAANAAGTYSHAEGSQTYAGGEYSHAEGGLTQAIGQGSHAEGIGSVASGYAAHAEGFYTTASSTYTHAEGTFTTAGYDTAHAEGYGTVAVGLFSHAEGRNTVASGDYAHAEGTQTYATARAAHAEGAYAYATDYAAHAEGSFARAAGYASHAEGAFTQATGDQAHAEGYYTYAVGKAAHTEGHLTYATAPYSHAEGILGTASNDAAHAEGYATLASGYAAHAAGRGSQATGPYSHAEGYFSSAVSRGSHAEGGYTSASDDYAHAEGSITYASGYASHAEGLGCRATGYAAHAEGRYTEATGDHSHAEGSSTYATADQARAGGRLSVADVPNQIAQGAETTEAALAVGSLQASVFTLGSVTSDASGQGPKTLLPQAGSFLTIRPDTTYSMQVIVTARQTNAGGGGANGDCAMWFGTLMLIRVGAAAPTLVSAAGLTKVESNGVNGAALATPVLSADIVNNSLDIAVTGIAGADVTWHASIFDSEAGA